MNSRVPDRKKRGSHNVDWEDITRRVLEKVAQGWVPTLANKLALVEDLRAELHDGKSEPNIFDPGLVTLERVPPGWLSEKIMPLSWDTVMARDFDVAVGIEKLIHVGRDEGLIEDVFSGWSSKHAARLSGGTLKAEYHHHIRSLKRLQGSAKADERRLFGLIFTGMHRSALKVIEDRCYGSDWSEEGLVLLVVRQLLALCAFDVQRLAYYLRESAQEPLPGLLDRVEGEYGYIRASALKSALMTSASALDEALEKFRPFADADLDDIRMPAPPKRRGAPVSDPRKENPTIRIWNVAATALGAMSRDQLAPLGHALNGAIPGLQRSPSPAGDVLRAAIKEGTELPEMLTHYRFSGLDPSACLLVALLRFVQAEQYYLGMYDRYLRDRKRGTPVRVSRLFIEARAKPGTSGDRSPQSPGLPAFHPGAANIGRVVTLAGAYQRLIIKHAGRAGKEDDLGPSGSDSNFRKPMKQAKLFLKKVGERRIEDHAGPAPCERRTFDLLDVHPEWRLWA
ncbi:hypothetical protein ACFQRC_04390 [Enterovirga sp. GCM10030262]|uniref:hypothetical protein n=1 Tax=Enterovirga sp. GCM10030262 TaxID=3273391 RepID=UPI0036136B1C